MQSREMSDDATGVAQPAPPHIEFDHVTRRFDEVVAVRDLSLTIMQGEVFVLLGQSGCGKSTVLQLVNRMLEPESGTVRVGGIDVRTMDAVALRRTIGYVIQQVGLFPHRTVAANVATVCVLSGWDRSRTRQRVDEMLRLVGLDPSEYGRRYPHQLSGGQQQRVGVARALAAAPPVLLMDEPFGALDPQIRRGLQSEFRTWVRTLGTTVVFVTHDVDEATVLADRIAVLGPGARLDQVGTPPEVLGHPATPEIADFLGADRVLRRLSVIPAANAAHVADGDPHSPMSPSDISAYDALLALIDSPTGEIALAGEPRRVIDWAALADLARG